MAPRSNRPSQDVRLEWVKRVEELIEVGRHKLIYRWEGTRWEETDPCPGGGLGKRFIIAYIGVEVEEILH